MIAWLALGSNLGDRAAHLRRAITLIGRLEATRIIARSSVYASEPWGDSAQPEYYNAVVAITTPLTPNGLLEALQRIETQLGRLRDPNRRYGPRTLDLDILAIDGVQCANETLTLPHPHAHTRRFVIEPLAEIAPDHPLVAMAQLQDAEIKKLGISLIDA